MLFPRGDGSNEEQILRTSEPHDSDLGGGGEGGWGLWDGAWGFSVSGLGDGRGGGGGLGLGLLGLEGVRGFGMVVAVSGLCFFKGVWAGL